MSCRAGKFHAYYNAGGLGRLSRGFAEKAKSAADKALAGTCHLDSDSVLCTSTRSCSQVAGHLCCLTSRNTALDCARAAAEAADAANKATRQPTLYLAKEMGVVRQAKEMTSPKVGEIPVSELLTLLTLLLLGFSSESSKLACCVVPMCDGRVDQRWRSCRNWSLRAATVCSWYLLWVGGRLSLLATALCCWRRWLRDRAAQLVSFSTSVVQWPSIRSWSDFDLRNL